VQIGLHSHNHPDLALLSPQELAADTAAGVSLMEHKLGQRPRFFALPIGGHENYNPQVIAILQDFGLEVIFGTHYEARLASQQSVLPRILITQQDNSDTFTFRQEIWGAHGWWGEVSRANYVLKKLFIK
jgi:peptidoglycan/xylan/chitin deacetylase (PgdA/CDA1 family)